MVSRRLGALALFLLSALAPAFLSQAPVASRLRPLTMQAALERAPMRAWPFGPAPTSARPWLWRPLGALRDNLVFLSLALSALSFALNFRSSKPGRVLQAVKTIRKPFRPELAKDRIAERDVVDSIAKRIENWMGHATIIAGRFGSGKTVALEEALRDRRGVYVHTVRDKDWEKSLYYDLGLDNLTMLKNVLRLVRKRNQGSTPILVLDIPRTTKEGMDTVSSLAKTLSSDGSLAHAGTRRLSRPVSLCCGRSMVKHVYQVGSVFVSCASCSQGFFRGDRVRIVGRHGHRLRCRRSGTSGELLGRRLDRRRGREIADPPRAQGQKGRIP